MLISCSLRKQPYWRWPPRMVLESRLDLKTGIQGVVVSWVSLWSMHSFLKLDLSQEGCLCKAAKWRYFDHHWAVSVSVSVCLSVSLYVYVCVYVCLHAHVCALTGVGGHGTELMSFWLSLFPMPLALSSLWGNSFGFHHCGLELIGEFSQGDVQAGSSPRHHSTKLGLFFFFFFLCYKPYLLLHRRYMLTGKMRKCKYTKRIKVVDTIPPRDRCSEYVSVYLCSWE